MLRFLVRFLTISVPSCPPVVGHEKIWPQKELSQLMSLIVHGVTLIMKCVGGM